MMLLRRFKLAIVILLLCLSCKKNESNSDTHKEKDVITDIVKILVTDVPQLENKNYLINPNVGKFEFNSFFNAYYGYYPESKAVENVFNDLNIDKETFDNIQNDMKVPIFKKELINYSKGNESNVIINFSNFHEKLVFIEIFLLCNKYNKEELLNINLKEEPKAIVYSFTVLLDQGVYQKEYLNGIIHFELQCGKE